MIFPVLPDRMKNKEVFSSGDVKSNLDKLENKERKKERRR